MSNDPCHPCEQQIADVYSSIGMMSRLTEMLAREAER
jgi:hypothetical protein